ncbi:low-density lipoprotein receptor-related 1B, partial [Sigmodon hispidus]
MMTVGTGVMRWAVFTPALMTSSDVPVADVSQGIGPVMVTMTVETSVMKHTSTVPNWKFILLLAALGMNFSATLMETASLICGAVMEKKTVKMAAMRRAAMVPFVCVTTKPSSPAGVQ